MSEEADDIETLRMQVKIQSREITKLAEQLEAFTSSTAELLVAEMVAKREIERLERELAALRPRI